MDKATENYIPYGPEWEKEMMKQKKEYLIAMIRRIKEQPKEYTDIDLAKSWRLLSRIIKIYF